MKAKPPQGEPTLPTHLAGSVVMRVVGDQLIFAKAPRKRGPAKSGYPFKQQQEFALVQRLIKYTDPTAWQTAKEWSLGTSQLPRDVLAMCAYGTWITIEDDEGNVYEGARLANPDAQYILDGVTSEVGSILYRSEVGWVGLPPGDPGQVLGLDAQALPEWGGIANQQPSPWRILAKSYYPVDGNGGQLQCLDFKGCDEIMVIANNVSSSAGNRAYFEASVDGGSTWLGASNYRYVTSAGVLATPTLWDLWNGGSTGARSGVVRLFNVTNTGYPKYLDCPNQNRWGFLQGNWNPVNACRVLLTGTDSKTSGGFWILGR